MKNKILMVSIVLALAGASYAISSRAGSSGSGGTQQCANSSYGCKTTASKYETGGSATVTSRDGSSTTYARNSSTTLPSLTANTISAPYVVYLPSFNTGAGAGSTGTGTGTGTDCADGTRLSSAQCNYSVQSGGNTGDTRTLHSYTRHGSSWHEGSGTASCTASGWTFAATPSCTPTADPGTPCGGCTHSPSGWTCTFCE